MFSQIIGRICKSILDLIVAAAAAMRISPNILTLAGFLVTIVSAVYLARGKVLSGRIDHHSCRRFRHARWSGCKND